MKPRTLDWLAVTAAAAAAVMCWYLLSMKPDTTPRTVGKGLAPAAQVTGNQFATSAAEPLPKFGTDEFKSALKARGLKWLDSHGRKSHDLLTMWDLTGDRALLDEAAEKYPYDPRVCMVLAQRPVLERKLWIERFIAAEPDNPEGFYLKAWVLMPDDWMFNRRRDHAGAIAALREAAAKVPGMRDTHGSDRMKTMREAGLAIGATPAEAARLALASKQMPTRSPVLSGVAKVLRREIEDWRATGDQDRVVDVARLGYTVAHDLKSGGAVSFADAIAANDLELEMLRVLPHDTKIGTLTAGSLLEESRLRRIYLAEAWKAYSSVPALLAAASDDTVVAYAWGFQNFGEFDAVHWLLSQSGKAK